MSDRIVGFAPIYIYQSKILILGSMPSVKSLEEGMYYSHPRNLFWPLIFGIYSRPYSSGRNLQVNLIHRENLALWDVIHSCQRQGSADTKIKDVEVNNFSSLKTIPKLRKICFNGAKAEELFKHLVVRNINASDLDHLSLVPLPSTSLANASINIEKKKVLGPGL